MSVRLTNDRIIIEIPTEQPTQLYAGLSKDLLTFLQELSDPERPFSVPLWNVLELTRAIFNKIYGLLLFRSRTYSSYLSINLNPLTAMTTASENHPFSRFFAQLEQIHPLPAALQETLAHHITRECFPARALLLEEGEVCEKSTT